ncbi:YlbG family protein [Carnobacterium gallinarum]|uniref:YlbG family protein n=1 Tax=Carnobacterium gallinarum TaxID=2749 RepID=UPI00054E5DC3|nr:YlbG family protein [Carnobacterium gallinarum]
MEHALNERQGIIVWVYSLRHLKTLKRFGLIHYVSKRMKYVVIYVDRTEAEAVEKKLNGLHFVRMVELSHRPEINMDFGDRIGSKHRKEVEPLSPEEPVLIEVDAQLHLEVSE